MGFMINGFVIGLVVSALGAQMSTPQWWIAILVLNASAVLTVKYFS